MIKNKKIGQEFHLYSHPGDSVYIIEIINQVFASKKKKKKCGWTV